MLIKEILVVALQAIRVHALRSFLTTLGIIIGVGAVIAMVSLGEGAQRRVEEQIQAMGTNVLTIRPGQSMFGGIRDGGARARLYDEDAEALHDQTLGTLLVAPEIQQRQQISYLRWNSSHEVLGTWPEYLEVQNIELALGRMFDEGEVQGRRRVAVVGWQVPNELETPAGLLLGRTIQVRGIPFEVIGVLDEQGEASPWSQPDERVYIPLSTAQYRVFGGRDRLNSISVKVLNEEAMDGAYADIDRILRREHRIPPGEDADFSIRNSAQLLESFNETQQTFTYLLGGIAAISLLVGGIGIMNIMLVSVTERTREIGIRKALGATRMNIMLQFIIESLALCTLGGILGVGAGVGSAELLSRTAGWETAVAPAAVAVALLFSAGIGLFFGIWPARRAALLDPIDALRYE